MEQALDIRVTELLCSRICHDLVSPVGAINNGVELIEEMGSNIHDEALGLIAHSAGQAWRRLRCFRIAYGAASSESMIGYEEIRAAAESFLEGTKTSLRWSQADADGATETTGSAKILLNVILLGHELLPYGGEIEIAAPKGELPVVVISGRAAALSDSVGAMLAGRMAVEDLTPRTVHAYFTGFLARRFGIGLAAEREDPGRLEIRLVKQPDVV